MKIDMEKIGALTSIVNRLIELRNLKDSLDEKLVAKHIEEAVQIAGVSCSNEELDLVRQNITAEHLIRIDPGVSILLDYDMDYWYEDAKPEIIPEFWVRYKNYLIDKRHFSPSIVSALGENTLDQKLMNYILNPKATYHNPMLRRGLIIGDVQSGKTSTYIGLLCKAADAGYKVFILLTGMIESLRQQTQARVEEGFIGIDMTASSAGGKRVGVGQDNKPIRAVALTSRKGDFTGDSNKIALALSHTDDVVFVFVIKKQTNVLTKLKNWLISLNADPATGKINMPMLMVDDEADNASINTNKDKENPTIINRLIRELANIFTVSSYVGFTATPFANVFIDPETPKKMAEQDLFPEDFIFALPTPPKYIGPNQIFAANGKYHSQLIYITDAGREKEDGHSFYFKHDKEWADKLPESLTDAIYTFYLANAIRDLREDWKEHRSMLVNISRFINVQQYVKSVIEDIHTDAYRAVKFNLSSDFSESMRNPILKRIYQNWENQYARRVKFAWNDVAGVLFQSIENIQIQVVNSSKTSYRLAYPKNESLRVIAIGGLALSRGLTLEGLVVSYFYRNTCTYDVLMQMGRWFGYRQNYEDLFRIWTHKSSAQWYAEIAEATDRLKTDMAIMCDHRMKPRDFGIRVRHDSDDLRITAYNKMRNATDEFEVVSYFGSMVETPYLCLNTEAQIENFRETTAFVERLVKEGFSFERQVSAGSAGKGHYIIQNIPKGQITSFIRRLKISRYSSDFDTFQIAEFLDNSMESCIQSFDLAFMEGAQTKDRDLIVTIAGREISKVIRSNCTIDHAADRLDIGRRGRLGGTSDGKTGIVDFQGHPAIEIIREAERKFREDYQRENGIEFTGKSLPSNIWFRYVDKRRPLILIYLIDIRPSEEDRTQVKQIEEFRNAMGNIPAIGVAMGIPKCNNTLPGVATHYKANKAYNWFKRRVYNWFERDEILAQSEEE